jgi:hypothetical protein
MVRYDARARGMVGTTFMDIPIHVGGDLGIRDFRGMVRVV